jgi:ribosome recycling factor
MADEDVALVIDETGDAMKKAIEHLRHDLQKIRTGRANTALLDGIQVEYYGTPTPLNQLATLSAPDPRLIVISPFDKSSIQAIEKAIQASDLGLTPANDGKVVRIPIPPLTEERRKELVKHVHKVAEQHKVGVREARRDGLALLKDAQKDGTISEDERHRAEKKVQDLTDEHTATIDKMSEQKEKEVLEV